MQPSSDVSILVNPETTKSLLDYSQASADPDIWIQVDAYGKSLYSTVLADLGQSSGPNILSEPDLLQQYTQTCTTSTTANARPRPATQSYDDLQAQTGPLSITQSTINQQYICQVPTRNSTGTSIIAVTIADLVFLQALWKLLNLSVMSYIGRKDPMSLLKWQDLKIDIQGMIEGHHGRVDEDNFLGRKRPDKATAWALEDLLDAFVVRTGKKFSENTIARCNTILPSKVFWVDILSGPPNKQLNSSSYFRLTRTSAHWPRRNATTRYGQLADISRSPYSTKGLRIGGKGLDSFGNEMDRNKFLLAVGLFFQ